jgi:hypothetical protein
MAKGIVTQEEVIYYELVKMEERITEKADAVLKARDEVETMLQRFEILSKELINKLEEYNKKIK